MAHTDAPAEPAEPAEPEVQIWVERDAVGDEDLTRLYMQYMIRVCIFFNLRIIYIYIIYIYMVQ